MRTGLAIAVLALAGCATQTPPIKPVEAPGHSIDDQRRAQQSLAKAQPEKPTLKRKIALGRVTNETMYGRSLLRDKNDDPLGKQITDLLSKSLTDSGAFLVIERPDIGRLKDEAALTGQSLNLVGVDALVVGSLTEFGRKTVGETGFLSQSKRQVAFAKVDFRLVDASTGHVFFTAAGAGESSTETASVAGFGSQAGYDGTLNDSAIRQAVSEAVNKLSTELLSRPWRTYILSVEGNQIFIGGGRSQGLKPGMLLRVETVGKKVRSPQTGFDVTLPGQRVAQVRIESTFGDSEATEGSVATIVQGDVKGRRTDELVVLSEGN
jgi:curli biogenesis system outer membrane secretion channel CsgG